MAVALLALFVAMGGVSYAAAKIGSKQIKNNSVRGKDIRNGTVAGKDLKNGSTTGKDVKKDSLTGDDILESSLGQVPSAVSADTAKAVGPNGVNTTAIQDNAVTQAKLADDTVGAAELKTTTLVANTAPIPGPIGTGRSTSVQCPAGTQVLSGGGTAGSYAVHAVSSFRSGNGWIVAYQNTAATASTISAYATCLVQ